MASDREVTAESAAMRFRSGIALPRNAVTSSLSLVVEATEFTNEDLGSLVDDFMSVQMHYPFIKPTFLISAMNPAPLNDAHFNFETAMTRSAWSLLKMTASYEEYVERRVSEMITVYSAQRAGRLTPGARVPRWFYER